MNFCDKGDARQSTKLNQAWGGDTPGQQFTSDCHQAPAPSPASSPEKFPAQLPVPTIAAGIGSYLDPAVLPVFQVRLILTGTAPISSILATFCSPWVRAVRECMPVLFDLLREEADPAVRVVLGDLVFVLFPSLYEWQWPHGEISNECHAGRRRLPLDGYSGRRGQSSSR